MYGGSVMETGSVMGGDSSLLVVTKMVKGFVMARIDMIDISNPGIIVCDDIVKESGDSFAIICHDNVWEVLPFCIRERTHRKVW